MLIATDNASVSLTVNFKGEYNALDIFGVVATLDVPARSESDGCSVPYEIHGATQWKRRRFV
jgi:hypothetical protein